MKNKIVKYKNKIILSSLIVMTIVFATVFGICVFGGEGNKGLKLANAEAVVQSTDSQTGEVTPEDEQKTQPSASGPVAQQVEGSPSPTVTTDAAATALPNASQVPGMIGMPQTTAVPVETNIPAGEVVPGIQFTPGPGSTDAPTYVDPTTGQQVTEGPTQAPTSKATELPWVDPETPTKHPEITPTKQPTEKPTEKPAPTVKPTETSAKITFTVDASVIGNGCYVSNHHVTLKAGEPASATITRGLENAGFSYENTGSISSSFYLARIKKSGMVKSPSVSSHIQDILDDNGVRLRIKKYDPDSLGEFDFTNYSGWRYSVNGTYAGVGMSDYDLKDGDHVLLKYTLCLGYDA